MPFLRNSLFVNYIIISMDEVSWPSWKTVMRYRDCKAILLFGIVGKYLMSYKINTSIFCYALRRLTMTFDYG